MLSKTLANCNLLLQRARKKLNIWLPICSCNSGTRNVAIAFCKNFISENIWERVSPWDLCELILIYSNRGLSFILTSNWFYVFHSSLKKCKFRYDLDSAINPPLVLLRMIFQPDGVNCIYDKFLFS